MSAPARLIAVRCSKAVAVPSIQPFSAAAFNIAYSPDERHIELGPGRSDDVEVGEGWLHHDHVDTFGDVEADLFHGFAGVGGVLLVSLAIASVGDGDVDCVAERAVLG